MQNEAQTDRKRVVMLVDNKKRDLMVAALVAYQLKQRNIDCYLEPLEAYRGSLAAHRPHMMIFNHLVASHLVDYSKRIGDMGVLTSVLLNEGLCYGDEERNFNAGKHHKGAHIDYFFCWNQPLKDALESYGFGKQTRIEVVGPARYDFYSPPWSAAFNDFEWPRKNGRPKLLVCSNFGLARFFYLPKTEAEKHFAPWCERIPTYKNWWGLVETNKSAQDRFLVFLRTILESKKFDVVLRTHPGEDVSYYRRWIATLPEDLQREVPIEEHANITSLILACDVQIGCENCNTTMESWIAGKPTVELIFDRHPVFYNPAVGALAPNCERPEDVVAALEHALANPKQEEYQAGRKAHLTKWCNDPSGKSTSKIADIIAERLANHPEPDWSKLDATDRRRAWKLRTMQRIGEAYHYKPLLGLRSKVLGGRHKFKAYVYNKSIKPKDVKKALELLETRLGQTAGAAHGKP